MSEFKQKKLTDLFSAIKKEGVVLPNFQRSFVWKPDRQKGLLSSLLVDLTFGIALVIEGNGGRFAVRPVGGNSYLDSSELEHKDVMYVLDGQQRITSLFSMFNTAWNDKVNYDDVFEYLKYFWFVHLDVPNSENVQDPLSDDETDIFGYNKLIFNEKNITKCTSDLAECHVEYKKVSTSRANPYYCNNVFKPEFKQDVIKDCIANKKLPLFWIFDENRWTDVKDIVKGIRSERLNWLKEWFLSPANKDKRAAFYEQSLDIDSNLDYGKHLKDLQRNDYNQDTLKDTYWNEISEKIHDWAENINDFLNEFKKRTLTLLVLGEDEFERSINIFSALNEGGTPLGLFDLAVARTSLSNQPGNDVRTLSDIVNDILKEADAKPIEVPSLNGTTFKFNPNKFGLIDEKSNCLTKNVSLQIFMLTLIGCCCEYTADNGFDITKLQSLKASAYKPNSILSNKLDNICIRKSFEDSCRIMLRVFAFAQSYLGINNFSEFRYTKMITAMACALAQDQVWQNPKLLKRLEAWYWYAVMSGGYNRNQNAVGYSDIFNLLEFLGIDQGVDVKVKAGKYYRSYEDLIMLATGEPNVENTNRVLNVAEYSDYQMFAKDNVNKKLSESLKTFMIKTKVGEQLLDKTTTSNGVKYALMPISQEQFKKLRSDTINYLQNCLVV